MRLTARQAVTAVGGQKLLKSRSLYRHHVVESEIIGDGLDNDGVDRAGPLEVSELGSILWHGHRERRREGSRHWLIFQLRLLVRRTLITSTASGPARAPESFSHSA